MPPPPPLSPSNPCRFPVPLQCNVEDDVFDGGNAPVEVVHRGQGQQWGGRAMHSVFVSNGTIVGGGCSGGGSVGGDDHTIKTPNYKRGGGGV